MTKRTNVDPASTNGELTTSDAPDLFTSKDALATDVEATPAAVPDPFDPAAYRISQDFAAEVKTEKVVLRIPVKKPGSVHWFRVHPQDEFRLNTIVLQLKEGTEAETYLIAPNLQSLFGAEPTLRRVTLFTAITQNNDVFLWPVGLPGVDGKDNSWNCSARESAALAMVRWVRLFSNQAQGMYEPQITQSEIPEPRWPNKSFRDLLELAFRDRRIESVDHPVLKRLRGEA